MKELNAELPIADWKHRPVGERRQIHIYSSALDDIENSYEPYVSVRNNQTTGEYDLLMTNIQSFHAGTYFCIDSNREQTTVETELIVINGNLFNPLVENFSRTPEIAKNFGNNGLKVYFSQTI